MLDFCGLASPSICLVLGAMMLLDLALLVGINIVKSYLYRMPGV